MTTVKEIMTPGAECIGEQDTLLDAARRMRELDVGALPICGTDERLKGILTDRDIVIRCIADGGDPKSVRARDLAQGTPVFVEAGGGVREALKLMSQHQVRRLPVIENGRLVGIVSQADVARNLPEEMVGDLVEAISMDR